MHIRKIISDTNRKEIKNARVARNARSVFHLWIKYKN